MVPFSRSRPRKQHSPQGVSSAKSHFSWCLVLGPFSGCFQRLPRIILWFLLGVLGPFSLVSDQEFVRDVKKCCPGLFLGEKSTRLVLQKYVNRTVHPSKIEGVLRMAYIFQKGFLKTTFCSAEASSGGFRL